MRLDKGFGIQGAGVGGVGSRSSWRDGRHEYFARTLIRYLPCLSKADLGLIISFLVRLTGASFPAAENWWLRRQERCLRGNDI